MHREDQDIFNIHNANQLHTENDSQESTDSEAKVSTIRTPQNSRGKEKCVLDTLRNNLPGCDFITCIFVTALQSYRADQCLRPFPSLYITNGNKDFETLRDICDSIPPLKDLIVNRKRMSRDLNTLLTWLFTDSGQPVLQRINYTDITVPGNVPKSLQPNYVFEVQYSKKVRDSWYKRKNSRDTFLAYHGSRIENFYSIMKVGLQQHLSADRVVLFGEGIYLTSDITVSAIYAPFGVTWKNSMLGSKHSVIAVCEIINDTEKVKCKDMSNRSRSVVKGVFGEVPEKYYVVTDSDMIRVKYLFVYKENSWSSIKSCLRSNIFTVLILMYVVMLLMLGFFSSSAPKKIWYHMKRLTL